MEQDDIWTTERRYVAMTCHSEWQTATSDPTGGEEIAARFLTCLPRGEPRALSGLDLVAAAPTGEAGSVPGAEPAGYDETP